MNGAASPRPARLDRQRGRGRPRRRAARPPGRRRCARCFGRESAIDLSCLSPRSFSASPAGGCISSTSASFVARLVEPLDAEGEAHAPLGAELVDEQRVLASRRPLEEQRRAAGLDRAVDDLGHLEVRIDLGAATRTSSPSRSSSAIHSRRSAGAATSASVRAAGGGPCGGGRRPSRARRCAITARKTRPDDQHRRG